MTPKVGPTIYRVAAVSGKTLAAGASATGKFRWPRDLFVTGLQAFTQSGDASDFAALEIRIQDETFQDMFTDGQGTTFTVPALGLGGGPVWPSGANRSGIRTFPLQHSVMSGDEWIFTVSNTKEEGDLVPLIFLHFAEAYA